MNHLEIFLSVASLSFQIVLCRTVFAKKVQRVLPLFATYVCVVLLGTIVFLLASVHFGFESTVTYYVAWGGVFVYGAAGSLAIAELCRYGLRGYRGIWALTWRLLMALSTVLLIHAWLDARGQPDKIAILGATFLRDFASASVIILFALLLIRNYYVIIFSPLERSVAIGMCFTCAVDAIGYTILRNTLTGYLYPLFQASQKALWPSLAPYDRLVTDTWSTVHLLCFMISMGIWCYAFRKQLPEMAEDPELLPAEVYRELSPAINTRLSTFNNRLVEILKP